MRTKYYVNRRNGFAVVSVVLMAASLLASLVCSAAGLWPGWEGFGAGKRIWWYTVLPCASELLFLLLLPLLGGKAIWATALPVMGAAVFMCVFSAGSPVLWRGALCCVLWAAAALVWFATVCGTLRSPLAAVLILLPPPLFRALVELRGAEIEWLPETALFGLMLSLLSAALSLRRRPSQSGPPMPKRSYISED